MGQGTLLVAVVLHEQKTRERLVEHLNTWCRSSVCLKKLDFSSVKLEMFPDLRCLSERLNEHFRTVPDSFAVVMSDQLVERGEFRPDAKEWIDPDYHRPLCTLAVTRDGKRIADIDWVVKRSASQEELSHALALAVGRLRYIVPPTHREYSAPFVVRQIEGEFELSQYYRLRHQVYSCMGYLPEQKEKVKSKLEIDGCDMKAIHLGAFEKCSGYQNLVGTARVLLAEAEDTRWAEATSRLLESDPLLKSMVSKETLPLGLPVFQSQRLNDELQQSYLQGWLCAELSRVIVSFEYRGAGISRRLVEAAIAEARKAGVHRLYLECLPLHESLYTKLGFRSIPGAQGQVIGVSRSMIAMKLEIEPARVASPVVAAG